VNDVTFERLYDLQLGPPHWGPNAQWQLFVIEINVNATAENVKQK
jgi:hypothetical protein